MIAVDTNIPVYAHRVEMPFHEPARRTVESLACAPALWAIPWPCMHEFLAVVTNPRNFRTPASLFDAIEVIKSFADLENVSAIGEGDGCLTKLEEVPLPAKVQGGAVHNAHIASICAYHGVTEFLTADRDFSRFPSLVTRNPLAL